MDHLEHHSSDAPAGDGPRGVGPKRASIIALCGLCIVSPAMAGADPLTLGQVLDTGSVTSKSVGDVVEAMKQWKLAMLIVSMVLVLALLFAGGLLRPGGYAKAGLRDVSPIPTAVWIFAAFVVILAMSSAPQLISQLQWIQKQEYTPTQMQAINMVAQYLFGIIAGLGMLFMLRRSAESGEGDSRSGLGLSFLDLPVGLGCFVLAFPFIELMNMLGVFAYTQILETPPSVMGNETLKVIVGDPGNPWIWAIGAGAVIGAPFVEELVFRVFLQGGFLRWLRSPWLAIIISAILFASIHRLGPTPNPWHTLLPIFALGLACGVAYERTRRVGVPIIMHICFNALNVLLALMISADAAPTGV